MLRDFCFSLQSDDFGPFNDLRQLETKPAHMSVFLNFILKQESPAALVGISGGYF